MEISEITEYLYVSGQPQAHHAAELRSRGISLIISMRGESRPPQVFGQPPFEMLWLRTFDFFLTPIPLAALRTGVEAALPVIEQGGHVLTHCHHGKHRSVAMAAAILIARGFSANDAMQRLQDRRATADPGVWYIRRQIQRFERQWLRER